MRVVALVEVVKGSKEGMLEAVKVLGEIAREKGESKTVIVTEFAKVPMWNESMTLEAFMKQVKGWNERNKDMEENAKYQTLI